MISWGKRKHAASHYCTNHIVYTMVIQSKTFDGTEHHQKLYLLQEIIITELGFAKHEVIQLQTSAQRARVM